MVHRCRVCYKMNSIWLLAAATALRDQRDCQDFFTTEPSAVFPRRRAVPRENKPLDAIRTDTEGRTLTE